MSKNKINSRMISWVLLALLYPIIISASWLDATIKFKEKVRVNDDSTGVQYHPLMVRDAYLNFYVVWEDDRDGDGNYEIYYSRSTDTGKTFEPDTNLSQNPTMNNKYPWIAIDESSRIYVVWQALRADGYWDIYFTRSKPFGVNFTPPGPAKGVVVNNNQDSEVNFGPQPKIFVDDFTSNDTTFLYLVWADGSGIVPTKILLARSISLGDTFETTGVAVSHGIGVCRHPAITVDRWGRVLCAFESGSGINTDPHPDIAFTYSEDRGKSFALDILVNDNSDVSCRRLNPVLTARGNKVYVVWEDSRQPPASADDNPYLFMAYYQFNQDTAFSQNLQVNYNSDIENYRPAISIDPTGLMVVAWHSGNSTDALFSIYVAGYIDTLNQFSTARKFGKTNTGNSGANFGNMFYPPSLVVDNQGGITHFYLCWQDYSDDPDGDVFFVEGYVTVTLADIDFFPDSLDADTGIVYFNKPEANQWTKKLALLINTDSVNNPDTSDGPSNSLVYISIDTFYLTNGVDTIFTKVKLEKDSLEIGECAVCTVMIHPASTLKEGVYSGILVLKAVDPDSIYEDFDSIQILANITKGDIDFFDNSLDAVDGIVSLNEPPSERWVYRKVLFMNSNGQQNPDSTDGPGQENITSITVETCYVAFGTIGYPVNYRLNSTALSVGEIDTCFLWFKLPDDAEYGNYTGKIILHAKDIKGYESKDSLILKIVAPEPKSTLDSAFVYPNPFRVSYGHKYIYFTNLTANSKIIIVDEAGHIVKRLQAGKDGGYRFEPDLPSGVYFYYIYDTKGHKKQGKFAIIR